MFARKVIAYLPPLPTDPLQLADLALAGDHRAIPRIITIFGEATEISRAATRVILRRIFPHVGSAHVIGITGPPGVGKSTMLGELIQMYLDMFATEKLACLLVDPTSQFSGGAILGDRLRIPPHLSLDPRLYIRSLAAGNRLGGLSPQIREAIALLDAAGYRRIILETVGVGQSEIEIVRVADTVVLACQPGSGDSVQMLKSGILEIGDIIIVNKGDLGNIADEMIETVRRAFGDRMREPGWKTPVIKTSSLRSHDANPLGLDALFAQVARHEEYLRDSGRFQEKRRARLEVWIRELVEREIVARIQAEHQIDAATDEVLGQSAAVTVSPYDTAALILDRAGFGTKS